jgi:hypothetical protein
MQGIETRTNPLRSLFDKPVKNSLSFLTRNSPPGRDEKTTIHTDRQALRPVDAGKKAIIEKLKSIDGTVRAHEAAHLAAIASNAAGVVQYTYVTGPDGQRYATGGSIAVNFKSVPGDPEATIRKARAIMASAYAPGDPSAADMRVATQAYLMETDAKQELEKRKAAGEQGDQETITGFLKSGGEFAATGRAVKPDITPVPGDPETTVRKAEAFLRTAYSTTTLSAADARLAAEAYRVAAEANQQLAVRNQKPGRGMTISLYA